MDLTAQLHVAAGIGAIGLGGAALLRDPSRRRNRLFAALCGSLVVWTLGVALGRTSLAPDFPWDRIYLLGSCLAAPLSLHLALILAGARRPIWTVLLVAAYGAALGVWIAAWFQGDDGRPLSWIVAAIVVLGGILLTAVGLLLNVARTLPAGPERRAYRMIVAGGIVGVLGGLSDFVPRTGGGLPYVGPLAVLVFLLVVCAVVVRHRFLDVDTFLARAVALTIGAIVTALVYFAVARVAGARFLPFLAASVVILLLAGPLWRGILYGTRNLFSRPDPTADAFLEVSRRLPSAGTTSEVWSTLDEGRRVLPSQVRIDVFLEEGSDGPYVPRYRTRDEPAAPTVSRNDALAEILRQERCPLTRRYLEGEAREADALRRGRAAAALHALESREYQMAVPLLRGDALVGWIAAGGIPERALTAELAAAFLAVGSQAVASIDRLDALRDAQQRRALAAVGEMAAGLAHEIRNPLAAVHGAAQALGPDADPEQSREMLEVIREEAERLGRVVGEFLEYARAESTRREAVDLGELALKVARAAAAAGIGLEITVDAPAGAPAASADPEQVRRVFENLVRNAWEATGSGGTLRVVVEAGRPGQVQVRFEDNGPGIEDEEISRVFEPFHSTRAEGTGLGLALVHRVVDAHGGTVELEGRPGRGAAFTIRLPAAENTT
jgi:signal transduction histidine kinase